MSESVRAEAGRPRLAVFADGLTASRMGLAIVIAAVVGVGDHLTAGTVLLCGAWFTDFADGRIARRAGSGTRLGAWDAIADSTIGLGVLVGLNVAGRIGWLWLLPIVLLVAGMLVSENLALGMAAQAVAYGLFIVELGIDAPGTLWLLGATVAVIGIADARRLVDHVLPTFFGGLGLMRRR